MGSSIGLAGGFPIWIQSLRTPGEVSSTSTDNKISNSSQHTPRVNNEIPDANDATFDHERLSERLSTYGLAELQIEGDGNCQFRALADQLFRNPDYHKHVRKQVVKQLKRFKRLYEGYVPMRYQDYLKKMKKLGEWGDHVTLQAAADRFGAKICLVTSFRDTCYIEILPKDKNPSRGDEFGDNGLIEALLNVKLKKGFTTAVEEIWLSFWSEVHYNSLYETGEVPTRVPKKRFWLF
ncbi:OVARIAN TUMOR DOMAIN-containing deubiquitinating enzyme 11-like isoform X4 [Coffea arabica]|uniref:OVARIAN TUMOR DOMAIN-containing deubiquitinating enzyme 11 isoform X3 n=1 Tax=Coffea arabica TaxID=13443 RepID=A0ABM4UGT1_COFAR